MKTKEQIVADYERQTSAEPVVITGIHMPFGDKVKHVLEWFSAALVAGVILAVPVVIAWLVIKSG